MGRHTDLSVVEGSRLWSAPMGKMCHSGAASPSVSARVQGTDSSSHQPCELSFFLLPSSSHVSYPAACATAISF